MNDPCYTCRRRRIECDRSGVPCAKCVKADVECFEKRPPRWVKGMAIRGKLQGLSAEDASVALRKKRASTVEPTNSQSGLITPSLASSHPTSPGPTEVICKASNPFYKWPFALLT